ncbi:MAG: type I methionyl aminopeptidase [Puniceicoccales bacterium]|jgi:methionyl aminopeptidase|nr:type I methionyl aminopeptidase [Puniceicoccales bacterium]
MIPIKTPAEIENMRQVCRAAALVLDHLVGLVKPGVTTLQLDEAARDFMAKLGVESACYNYKVGRLPAFPGYTCISVNEEVVHGIPSKKRVIRKGDIVSLDVVVRDNGFHGDNARTVLVEPVATEVRDLCKATEEALYLGIAQARAGNRVHDISHAIERHVKFGNYGIVEQYVGHGVGRSMHEDPQVPCLGAAGTGPLLKPGMTLAIEPMINLGTGAVTVLEDGWTAVSRDHKPSAHYEHTVLITKDEPEILTRVR